MGAENNDADNGHASDLARAKGLLSAITLCLHGLGAAPNNREAAELAKAQASLRLSIFRMHLADAPTALVAALERDVAATAFEVRCNAYLQWAQDGMPALQEGLADGARLYTAMRLAGAHAQGLVNELAEKARAVPPDLAVPGDIGFLRGIAGGGIGLQDLAAASIAAALSRQIPALARRVETMHRGTIERFCADFAATGYRLKAQLFLAWCQDGWPSVREGLVEAKRYERDIRAAAARAQAVVDSVAARLGCTAPIFAIPPELGLVGDLDACRDTETEF